MFPSTAALTITVGENPTTRPFVNPSACGRRKQDVGALWPSNPCDNHKVSDAQPAGAG